MRDFGKHLESLREQAGYSPGKVERMTDIDRSNLRAIEKGRKSATNAVLKALAPLYGIAFERLKILKLLYGLEPEELKCLKEEIQKW
jgi:transcriptional regulator with XRE-family HTH domain